MRPDPRTAIFFHPDQVEGTGKDLVGRRSAGESFLKGYLRHVQSPDIRAVTETLEGAKALEARVRELGDPRPVRASFLRGGGDITDTGCIFFPTPGYSSATWLRQRLNPASCSLVGITHTVSTRRIIESLHTLLSEPVEPWDAIICTSRAVRSVVARQFELEAEYLRQRFGATRTPQPRLPVIPLGIAAAEFAPVPGARERIRAAQGVAEGDLVVMTMGRLSVVEKANPWPLFVAIEAVAKHVKRPIHLWICGWASRPEEEKLHIEAAAAICKSLTVKMIDGREPDVRRNIWAGADIFTLPSDSIQETFGLVPVEAMAAGLPVVMPDWDGFRDTVRHGETGFLVPTRMAAAGTGKPLARRFADGTDGYMQYLTLVQGQVQIDVPAYATALLRLIEDADLRARMGRAGQDHVKAHLDWSAVIPQYLDLARDLEERRAGAVPTTPTLASGPVSPLEVDPFDLYADYPTATLSADTLIEIGNAASAELLQAFDRFSGRDLYQRRLFPQELALRVANAIRDARPTTAARLSAQLQVPLATILSVVLYLAKADIVRLPRIEPR
jgi:starch synthase